jgi:hypothetical protein
MIGLERCVPTDERFFSIASNVLRGVVVSPSSAAWIGAATIMLVFEGV